MKSDAPTALESVEISLQATAMTTTTSSASPGSPSRGESRSKFAKSLLETSNDNLNAALSPTPLVGLTGDHRRDSEAGTSWKEALKQRQGADSDAARGTRAMSPEEEEMTTTLVPPPPGEKVGGSWKQILHRRTSEQELLKATPVATADSKGGSSAGGRGADEGDDDITQLSTSSEEEVSQFTVDALSPLRQSVTEDPNRDLRAGLKATTSASASAASTSTSAEASATAGEGKSSGGGVIGSMFGRNKSNKPVTQPKSPTFSRLRGQQRRSSSNLVKKEDSEEATSQPTTGVSPRGSKVQSSPRGSGVQQSPRGTAGQPSPRTPRESTAHVQRQRSSLNEPSLPRQTRESPAKSTTSSKGKINLYHARTMSLLNASSGSPAHRFVSPRSPEDHFARPASGSQLPGSAPALGRSASARSVGRSDSQKTLSSAARKLSFTEMPKEQLAEAQRTFTKEQEESVVSRMMVKTVARIKEHRGVDVALPEKVASGVYTHGTKRINVSLNHGELVVRVGGGYMSFEEYMLMYQFKLKMGERLILKKYSGRNVSFSAPHSPASSVASSRRGHDYTR
eukprot:GFYU01004252.1.p1 GENE.GFYU01004252.1~~GFYU01004252.1.p1  ORF type:complete len:662 (-),score=92.47 GFYU01004252.1:92-1795(-)